jgi:RecA-family ATPase
MKTTTQQWVDEIAHEGQPAPGVPAVLVDPTTVTQPRKNLTATNEWAEAFLTPPGTPDFVLPGLEAGEVSMLVSPGGTGKSWWALLSAISTATGLDLLGLKALGAAPKRARVRYISFEDTREVLRRRMFAIGQAYSPMLNQKALDHLSNMMVTTTHYGRYDLLKLNLDAESDGLLDDHTQGLVDAVSGCRLAVIDTLSQSHSGDENNTAAMARLVGNLQHLARTTGAAILVLHHTSKGAALNGLGDDANAARGSSTLINNIRCGYFMAGMTEAEGDAYGLKNDRSKYVRWGTSKTNHIAAVNGVWFEKKAGGCLVPVELVRKGSTTKKTGGAL